MSRKKYVADVMTTEKKLTELQHQILALQEKEQSLQNEMITYFSSLLSSIGAFSIPKNILIGGILHVIKSYEENTSEIGEWQKAGNSFLSSQKTSKAT